MNKKIGKIVYLLMVMLVACNTSKSTIEIKQSIDNTPIVIRLSEKYEKVFRIKLPIEVELKNNSIRKKNFNTFKYDYGSNRGVIEFIYIKYNNKLTEINNNQKKAIQSHSSEKYIIYTSHKLDSNKLTQQHFKPYIEKMLLENKDTLHIGTVTAFKKKHKELFEKLTKGDSLSIQFLDGKKLGEKITVPVKW